MRVLVIGYVWPEPNSSAAGSRMLALLDLFVGSGWSVTFASPAAFSEHAVDLGVHGVATETIALNCPSFDEFIDQLQPELVLFDRFMMEEQFGWRVESICPNALRVLDTEDLHCLRDARHSALKQNRDVQEDDFNSDVALREIAAILRSDLSLIISTVEMALLQEQFNVDAQLLHYCPFMLSIDGEASLESKASPFESRQHFINIGNFRHAPNWDSVLWLNSDVWPLIRKQLPQAQLHIYGAYPPPKATALHNPAKGFHVLGWADDAFEVMSKARVCLAPLRFGAGIKGKFADAMLCGTPSVTTSIGAESMWGVDEFGADMWPGLVAEAAGAIASAAVELYQDAEAWQLAQVRGGLTCRQNFDGKVVGEKLLKAIEDCIEQLKLRRANNFTGAMLRHHHHRSTKYMSQWIEAKNKLISQ